MNKFLCTTAIKIMNFNNFMYIRKNRLLKLSIPSSSQRDEGKNGMRVAAINTAYGRSIKQLSTHFQFKIADRKRAIMSNKKKRSFNENENFLNYDAFKTSLIYRHTRTHGCICKLLSRLKLKK